MILVDAATRSRVIFRFFTESLPFLTVHLCGNNSIPVLPCGTVSLASLIRLYDQLPSGEPFQLSLLYGYMASFLLWNRSTCLSHTVIWPIPSHGTVPLASLIRLCSLFPPVEPFYLSILAFYYSRILKFFISTVDSHNFLWYDDPLIPYFCSNSPMFGTAGFPILSPLAVFPFSGGETSSDIFILQFLTE